MKKTFFVLTLSALLTILIFFLGSCSTELLPQPTGLPTEDSRNVTDEERAALSLAEGDIVLKIYAAYLPNELSRDESIEDTLNRLTANAPVGYAVFPFDNIELATLNVIDSEITDNDRPNYYYSYFGESYYPHMLAPQELFSRASSTKKLHDIEIWAAYCFDDWTVQPNIRASDRALHILFSTNYGVYIYHQDLACRNEYLFPLEDYYDFLDAPNAREEREPLYGAYCMDQNQLYRDPSRYAVGEVDRSHFIYHSPLTWHYKWLFPLSIVLLVAIAGGITSILLVKRRKKSE